MSDKRKHKERIKELEEVSSSISDTGEIIEIDRADMTRAVAHGQIEENVFWTTIPEMQQIPVHNSEEEAVEAMKAKARKTTEAGTLPGAMNLPLDALSLEHSRLNKRQPVILCCARGLLCSRAARTLAGLGFSHIYHIALH